MNQCDRHSMQIKVLTTKVEQIQKDNKKHYDDILSLLKDTLKNNNKIQSITYTFYFKIIGICIAIFAILLGAKEALL